MIDFLEYIKFVALPLFHLLDHFLVKKGIAVL